MSFSTFVQFPFRGWQGSGDNDHAFPSLRIAELSEGL